VHKRRFCMGTMGYLSFKAGHAATFPGKFGFFLVLMFSCLPVFAGPFEKLSVKLQRGIEDYPNIKLAVLEFPYIDGKWSDGPVVVQERLTTLFAKNKKITLMERNLLQKVAGELKLQASGATDEASTQQVGKLLGAEAVLTGTLNDVGEDEVEINARVLIVQTAKIVVAEKITIKKTWKDYPAARKAAGDNVEALVARFRGKEGYTFRSVHFKSGRVQKTYFRGKAVIAEEVFGKDGRRLKSAGPLPDGVYREYYGDGALKTEKILVNSREYGALKTYFPGGRLENEAYYSAGQLDGPVKIFNENGKLRFEQNFRNGVPDGYFREYDDKGAVKFETFYAAGHVAAAPAERAITVKSVKLARGGEFSFYEDGKYLCKITVDGKLNIVSEQKECPDGIARAYSGKGKLEKEFVFAGNRLSVLRDFDKDGNVATEKKYASKN